MWRLQRSPDVSTAEMARSVVLTREIVGAAFQGVLPRAVSFQASQTITFGALSNVMLGVAPFAISATASSGLAVSFTSSAPCTYAIAPSGTVSLPAGAATGTVQVTTGGGCSWNASSNSAWIGIAPGAGGTGNGTVSYSVAANTSTSQRTGTLAIAGITLTVTQAGAYAPPQINASGIVNNASYNLQSSSVAAGSIAALFGANLTDGTSCLPPSCNPAFGSDGKLGTTMAGAQVTVNGTAVPIFYAAPTQLGIQIPFEAVGASATVSVSVGGQASTAATVPLALVAPGIFTATADGKGAGAITHANGSAVTAQNPAQPGEVVVLYATGLGQVTPAVATGALPAVASNTVAPVTASIGGISVTPAFAGLAGCCVGLNQINVEVPLGVSPGNAVPVVLTIGGQSSNTATMAVQ